MRWRVLFLASTAVGCAPLQIAGGGDLSRGGARPRAEARLTYLEAMSRDVRTHEAIWLGATGVLGITTDGAEGLVGPELQLSRGRDARGANPTVDVLYFRPELGWPIERAESRLSFWGASVGGIRQFGSVPVTAALRVGDSLHGAHSGLSVGLTIGIVIGTSLYWMQ